MIPKASVDYTMFPSDLIDHFAKFCAIVEKFVPFSLPENMTIEDQVTLSCTVYLDHLKIDPNFIA